MRNEKEILRILDSLDQPSKDRFVRKLKTYKNECGCKLGGIFAISAIIICLSYALLFHPISVFAGIELIFWSAIVVMAAGLVGKGIGIGVARLKLTALYRTVLRLYH